MTPEAFLTGLQTSGLVVDTGNGTEAFLHRSFLEYLAAAHVATLDNPVAEIERFLWQPDRKTGNRKWEPAAEEFLIYLAGRMKEPSKMLERIQRENKDHPDALYVMARLAGHCLVDVDPTSLDEMVVDTILNNAEEAYYASARSISGYSQKKTSRKSMWKDSHF
jgi:hypothetical protein